MAALMGTPKTPAPPTAPAPVVAPTEDQDSLDAARQKQAAAVQASSGRQSTILTGDSDKLGG